MTLDQFLRILRRRWPVVVLVTLVAAALGWFSAPGEGSRQVQYDATYTLLLDPQRTLLDEDSALNFEQAALLVTVGDVPDRAARRLGAADVAKLVEGVRAKPNAATGTLAVTATDPDPRRAEAVAVAFAEELVDELVEDDLFVYEARLADARARTSTLQQQLDELVTQAESLRAEDRADPALRRVEADLTAVSAQYQAAFAEADALLRAGPPQPAFKTLERPEARPTARRALRLPDGERNRAGLFAALGLAAGLALAVGSAGPETRIRSRADTEETFGVPVLAEIPAIPGLKRGGELLAVTDPASIYVEPFRSLSTVLLYAAAADLRAGGATPDQRRGRVVLVTSPNAGEGKTTTVANLAAVLAETRRKILVVSGDLRRPRVHELFDIDPEPGITDVLGNPSGGISLGDLRVQTAVPGVYLLPSGAPVENPAPLLRGLVRLISSARELFDFVIVDCAPVLVVNDAAELADAADMVVVLSWGERTTLDSARRAADMLRRVGAPLLGAVVVAGDGVPTAYRYRYRYRYGPYSGRPEVQREPPAPPTPDERVATSPTSPPAPASPAPDLTEPEHAVTGVPPGAGPNGWRNDIWADLAPRPTVPAPASDRPPPSRSP